MSISDHAFLRYQRQISVPEFGEKAQANMLSTSILVVGCGGLGSAAIPLLAGAGVGKLVIADHDCVDESNLHRQTHYNTSNIGVSKVMATKAYIESLNPNCKVRAIDKALEGEQLKLECLLADVVLDCSDNMKTRHQVNRACFEAKTTLISAAAIGWKGQLAVFDYQPGSPCYHCLFPFNEVSAVKRCSESGIIGPVVSMMGAYQALEAIKLVSNASEQVGSNALRMFDGLTNQWVDLVLKKDNQCDICCHA
ncbi:HesA/MoeB/ThiF family protein [Vibrio tapetis subsp. quintayensis]|uniref:HesA/MoeB/ThiF family protein n=1 Tax=Vibrio tapetis TaxID=52443 RepID=UPI0025B31A45|nr:HesA/MoeB/ThiF family protein [Vibrio tapetis]MDN3679642.1 HesA/MoeB/ThiF family protein [Vibrio tapetis subsp. quintayensis]